MQEQEGIRVVEGPPPEIMQAFDGWVAGLNEIPEHVVGVVHLRSFNAHALAERVHSASVAGRAIYFHYSSTVYDRDHGGYGRKAPILAARPIKTKDGDVLLLWLSVPPTELSATVSDEDEDE